MGRNIGESGAGRFRKIQDVGSPGLRHFHWLFRNKHFFIWLPVIVYYGFIHLLSAQSNPQLPFTFPFFDKIIHTGLYFIFGGLLFRSFFWEEKQGRYLKKRHFFFMFLVVILAGAIDEFHQLFVSGRSVEMTDWIADSVGGSLGVIIGYWIYRYRFRRL